MRIKRINQSSSGLYPQKVLPSPPKFHGSVTSIGLFGSRSYWPLPIIIRSRRRNLRLQNRFPLFCDLQQQQVLAGVLFLLLLIMSRMLRVAVMSICTTQLNITRQRFLVNVTYFDFFCSRFKIINILQILFLHHPIFVYFCLCQAGRNRLCPKPILIHKTTQKWQGFADNGACPIDPTGGETCRKEGKALLITESNL